MGIEKCKKCGTKFNYVDILDSSCWGYKPMICRSCGSKHKLKMIYILAIAATLSLPIFYISQVYNVIMTLKLSVLPVIVYIIYMAAVVLLYPFVIRYSLNENENEIERGIF